MVADEFDPPQATNQLAIETGAESWLQSVFPDYFSQPLADYHREFWDWVWQIEAGKRSETFIGIWPRGAGKSTSTEAAIAPIPDPAGPATAHQGETGPWREVVDVR